MQAMTQRDKHSPLKAAPLRNPGQSVDAQLGDLLHRRILEPVLAIAVTTYLAGAEWVRYYAHLEPHPIIYTAIAVIVSACAALVVWRSRATVKALKLGRDGERAVGQYLELLRESGARVLHDIVGDGFNIDHVVLAPQGIYVVETKTWSKPSGTVAKITFDGTSIRADGYKPDRDPVEQVIAQARWLRELLHESTGKPFFVVPVVVFPGWFVDPSATKEAKKHDVWLLNPKALPSFIAAEPERCSAEDFKLATFHLSRYIRATR
jgi:hypothetical protein